VTRSGSPNTLTPLTPSCSSEAFPAGSHPRLCLCPSLCPHVRLALTHGTHRTCSCLQVGTNVRKPSEKYTEKEYEELCATNQGAAFHLTRACFVALRRCRGCVINVSSVSGSTVDSTGAPYHMSKAALEHMTRYLACEWGPHGIRVNAVAPWFINTPLTAPLLADPRFRDAVRRATPLRRVGEVHEVACVVAFLAMPAAGYISGQVIAIDGAMTQEGFRFDRDPSSDPGA
jgi:Tropinone reductase 1